MLIVLVGPKGSGKSHIGRVLERHLGVHFFHVEPLWLAWHDECRVAGRAPDLAGGIARVHPRIAAALATRAHVCVETTGAAPEILADLLALRPPADRLVVRVAAPLDLCLRRIAARDPTEQIPLSEEAIRGVHALSTAAAVAADLALENLALDEAAIVAAIAPRLAGAARA